MSTAENKKIIRSLYGAINDGDMARIEEFFAPNFVDHSTSEQVPGPQGVRAYFSELRDALPDLAITIDDLLAESESAAVRTTWYGTLANGREVQRTMMQFFRFHDGLIFEEWNEGANLL